MGKLHAHVAQSAEADHANFLALADLPAAHGRVRGDSGAEQRRGSGEVQIRGNPQHESLVDDDAVGVAAIGDASEVLVGQIKGEREVRAELLQASSALGAGAVGIDHAADRREIAGLEFVDC